MSKIINTTESGLLLTGQGQLENLVVNSHTSGTVKIYDGLEGGANAVGTFTSAGTLAAAKHASSILTSTGAMVAATHATTVFTKSGNFLDATKASGVLTSDQTQPTAGKVVVLGGTTYTFTALGGTSVNTATAVNVPLGNNTKETMNNLYNAMLSHRDIDLVDIVRTSDYVITVTAKVAGTAGNSIAATEDDSHLDWDGSNTTLTGGTAVETITIGTKVYTWKDTLTATSTATDVQVQIGSTLTASLLNLKYAINGTKAYIGKSYGFGTVAHTQVIATASDATTITLFGRVVGTSLNTVATTETCASGSFPDTTLGGGTGASDAGIATTGAITTIGTTVYTVVDILDETLGATATAYQVLKGASEAIMLDNLKKAINATGTAGTEYSTGTVANTNVIATTNTNTAQTVIARTVGNAAFTTAINTLVTTTGMANTAWEDTTLGGGTGASVTAITNDTATFTINGRTYTYVIELDETSGATAKEDQILYVTSVAVALDNMKKAINASGIAGTDYSTGTTRNVDVIATTNANDSQVIQALQVGTTGNSITTTTTIVNHAWSAATLASGTGATGKVLYNTITFSVNVTTGERQIDFSNGDFTKGLYITVGGVADLSFTVNQTGK